MDSKEGCWALADELEKMKKEVQSLRTNAVFGTRESEEWDPTLLDTLPIAAQHFLQAMATLELVAAQFGLAELYARRGE